MMGAHGLMPKGLVAEGVAEQNQRAMYQMWAELMDGRSWDELRAAGDW